MINDDKYVTNTYMVILNDEQVVKIFSIQNYCIVCVGFNVPLCIRTSTHSQSLQSMYINQAAETAYLNFIVFCHQYNYISIHSHIHPEVIKSVLNKAQYRAAHQNRDPLHISLKDMVTKNSFFFKIGKISSACSISPT